MTSEILQKDILAIVIADVTDYAGDIGTRTDQIDLTSIAAGAARQSAKVDLMKAQAELSPLFSAFLAIEYDVAPTSGGRVDVYASFSPSAVAATANPGGCSGADGGYTGTPGDALADSLPQLVHIGSLVVTSDIAPQVLFQHLGFFVAPERYASFVVVNNGDQAFEGDAVEMGIRIVPYVPEIQ